MSLMSTIMSFLGWEHAPHVSATQRNDKVAEFKAAADRAQQATAEFQTQLKELRAKDREPLSDFIKDVRGTPKRRSKRSGAG